MKDFITDTSARPRPGSLPAQACGKVPGWNRPEAGQLSRVTRAVRHHHRIGRLALTCLSLGGGSGCSWPGPARALGMEGGLCSERAPAQMSRCGRWRPWAGGREGGLRGLAQRPHVCRLPGTWTSHAVDAPLGASAGIPTSRDCSRAPDFPPVMVSSVFSLVPTLSSCPLLRSSLGGCCPAHPTAASSTVRHSACLTQACGPGCPAWAGPGCPACFAS